MKYILQLVWMVLAINAFGQQSFKDTDAMLFGDVKDAETGEHIPFVNVIVKGTSIGTSTDATGHYMFTDLPVGEISIEVSSLGYRKQSKTIITVENKSQSLYFTLEPDAIMTEQVVVSASRNEINREDAPVIVSALTPKHLEAIESTSVADGLSFTPGLRVESNCQNCGFTQLRMNGLDGAYSQILVNSRPVFSGLAGVYGLEQIPTEMVERVEVIRGGGSAIFGGSAIAGTVNIITKDPINNTFQIGLKSSAIGVGNKDSDLAFGKNVNFNGAIVSDNRKAGVFLFGLHKEHDPWDANGDSFSELVKLRNTSAGFQAYYKPNNLSRISIEYHNLSELRRGGNRFDYLPHEADITEMVKHNNNSAGITYETYTNKESLDRLAVYASGQHIDRDSYYGADRDPSAYGSTQGLTTVVGTQYSSNYDRILKVPGTLTMGFENLNDRIHDKKLGSNGSDNQIVANQSVNTLGAYAQYQMSFARLKLLFGARADHYNIQDFSDHLGDNSGTSINPRANVLFDLTEKIQLRVSYSTGYRAPQIFDEDLHIEASSNRRIEHRNVADLKAEKSQSFSGSVRYKNDFGRWQTELLVEGFYTLLDNPFVKTLEYDSISDITWSVRSNGDAAEVYGSNIELTIAPSRKFYTQLGGTVQRSKYKTPQMWGEQESNTTDEIIRTPNSYAYFIMNFEPNKKLSVSFSGNYTGAMYVPHLAGGAREDGSLITEETLVKTESFFVFNIKAAYTVKITNQTYVEFSGGVKNLLNSYQNDFDYGVTRDAGYIYGPMRPRTIFVGIKFKM